MHIKGGKYRLPHVHVQRQTHKIRGVPNLRCSSCSSFTSSHPHRQSSSVLVYTETAANIPCVACNSEKNKG